MPMSLEQKLELVAKLEGLTSKAIAQLEWVLDNEDDAGALLKAAEAVLDRVGFAKQTKQEISGQVDLGITINHRFPPQQIGQAGDVAIQVTHRDTDGH